MAMRDAGVEDVSTPDFDGFHEFVRERYNYFESTAGWANMIKAVVIGLDPNHIRWENYDHAMTFDQKKRRLICF